MLCIELLIIPDVLVSLKMASMRGPHLNIERENFEKKYKIKKRYYAIITQFVNTIGIKTDDSFSSLNTIKCGHFNYILYIYILEFTLAK